MAQAEMRIVGVLVLIFSVIFPTLKVITVGLCLRDPSLLKRYRLARFFALESSKWSMADVMALSIFMSFVAFNGLIGNALGGAQERGRGTGDPDRQFEDSAGLLSVHRVLHGQSVPGEEAREGHSHRRRFAARRLNPSARVRHIPAN